MSVEIKGVVFFSLFEGIATLRGRAMADAVREALPDDLKQRLKLGGITRVGWYPVADYAAMHDATHQVIGGGEAFARELGYVATDIDTRGIIRFALGFASPEMLVRFGAKVAGTYVRGATLHVEPIAPKRYLLRWEGFHGSTPRIHAVWQGGIRCLLEKCGAKDVLVVVRPGDDPSRASFTISWT